MSRDADRFDASKEATMTPMLMLLIFNAGMLIGFVLHTLLGGASHEDATIVIEAPSSFREDLLVPIMASKNRYLH
jgi:hypothetical protein